MDRRALRGLDAVSAGLAHVAEKAWDLPHLVGGLCEGEISFDKVRALADVATPETERRAVRASQGMLCARAGRHRPFGAELARTCGPSSARSEHHGRFLRFNDSYRTISAQLPAESYAETKAAVDARVRHIPSDGATPLDQRRCDAFLGIVRSALSGSENRAATASPYVVVAHVPLGALVEDPGETSALAGELEHGGLIDDETVRRIACDATIVVAVDDDVGHTMYEGRAQRFPSDPQRREVRGGTDSVASPVVPT